MPLVFLANIDSARIIIDYSKRFFYYAPQVLPQSTSTNWVIYISPISVIIIFIISQYIAENNRKKELHRNWYFKAHLESSISKLEVFLIESSKIVEEYNNNLNSIITNTDEILILKSKTLDNLKDLIRRFEFEIIQPLKILYPNIFKSSLNELNSVQDLVTTLYDKETDSEIFLTEWSEIKGKIRAGLVSVLSKPVNVKSENYFWVFKK